MSKPIRALVLAAAVSAASMSHAVFLTQNTSQSIVAGSVACWNGVATGENSYSRGYTLASFGITQPFNVSSVQFGVELATGGGGSGSQVATVNIYDGFTVSGATLTYGSLLNSVNTSVADGSLFMHTVGITGTVTTGLLAVEVFIADSIGGDGDVFFIGSNSLGESAPSYIRAPACGISTNTSLSSIGFPGQHQLINVNGAAVPEPASLAVLGLGAVAVLRRRRRQS